MKIDIAHVYWLAHKLGMERAFFLLWRKKNVRYLINFPRRQAFKFSRRRFREALKSNDEISRVVTSLLENGYAITHVRELRGMPNVSSLQEEYESLLANQEKPKYSRSKQYIDRLIDDNYDFRKNKNKPFFGFVTNKDLFLIASNYLQLLPRRTSFKVWRSHFNGSRERIASQNWHRDYNEFQILRVFLYLNSVDKESGAGEYISGSHYLGDSYNMLEYSEESGTYATDEEISQNFEPARVIEARGIPGTIILLDTAGLHRGGFHQVPSERRVAILTFSTAADIQPKRIRL